MATSKTPLNDIFVKQHYDLQTIRLRSRSWYDQQILLLSKKRITPNRILTNNNEALTSRILPGNLYLYKYDPKYKEQLPYYDMFPMVFPWKGYKGGFIGLNLHYLPIPLRIKLMDNLLTFKNNDKMDATTRLKFSWQMIDGMSKFKLAEPCVKQYLYDHVMSPFVKVNSNDWATAMMLPLERFAKTSSTKVWKESTRK
jgi:hypothetical protein